MHMSPIFYEDFSYFGDFSYEISKRMMLEKVFHLFYTWSVNFPKWGYFNRKKYDEFREKI